MILTFWGVRGSVPVSGHELLRFGGNTACVSVQANGRVLLIDAGTGIRAAGEMIFGQEVFLVLSHLHADHVIGFPHFAPLFDPDATIHLPDWSLGGQRWSLLDTLDGVHVPFGPDMLRASIIRPAEDAETHLQRCGWDVATLPVNHPGGALAWRVRHRERTFVHITDNELFAPDPVTPFDDIVAFCRDADVLSHDAQWLDEEMPERIGWGHSSVSQTCELAIAARVDRLVLFHHDPGRTDDAVDMLRASAERRLRPHGIACDAASEGLRIVLE